jgi:hypothetical protein
VRANTEDEGVVVLQVFIKADRRRTDEIAA